MWSEFSFIYKIQKFSIARWENTVGPAGKFRQSLKFRRWFDVKSTSKFRRVLRKRRNLNAFSTSKFRRFFDVEIFLGFSTLFRRRFDVENASWGAYNRYTLELTLHRCWEYNVHEHEIVTITYTHYVSCPIAFITGNVILNFADDIWCVLE